MSDINLTPEELEAMLYNKQILSPPPKITTIYMYRDELNFNKDKN
jgi:hypothetical protein